MPIFATLAPSIWPAGTRDDVRVIVGAIVSWIALLMTLMVRIMLG